MAAKPPEAWRGSNAASTPSPSHALGRDVSVAYAGALAHDIPTAAIAHPVPSDSDEDSGVTHGNNSQRQSVHSGMDTATTE